MRLGYDVKVMSDKLDWIAVMAYDYHGQWDKRTGHVAPMYAHPEDDDVTFNTVSILTSFSLGCSGNKNKLSEPMLEIKVNF